MSFAARNRLRPLAVGLLLAALCRAPAQAPSGSGEASLMIFELGAGPLVGLDRPARGASLAAGLLFDLGRIFGPSCDGLEEGVQAVALYDSSLQAFALRGDLVLRLSPELRARLGYELPVGRAALSVDGASLPLAAGACPNSFAVSAGLGALGEAGSSGPRFTLEAEFGWTAYRLADPAQTTATQAAQSGIAGFAAGFRFSLLARSRWRFARR